MRVVPSFLIVPLSIGLTQMVATMQTLQAATSRVGATYRAPNANRDMTPTTRR